MRLQALSTPVCSRAISGGSFSIARCAALAAAGGAAYARSSGGTFSCLSRSSAKTRWPSRCQKSSAARLLAHVADTRLSLAVPPRGGAIGTNSSDNPTPYLLLVAPVVTHDETLAVVEIYQRPSELPTAPEGYLRFLAAVCELAADYERGRQITQLREQAGAGLEIDRFSQAVHASLNVRRVAYTIANDGRVLAGCDRLSVALARGRRCRLMSISGVDRLNPCAPACDDWNI